MFKSLSVSIMLLMCMVAAPAMATTYSLMGGIVISNTSAMADAQVINIDYDRVYLDLGKCNTAKTALEKAPVRRGTSSASTDYGLFNNIPLTPVPMVKTVILECVPIN